jgi:hypothetical protein
MPRPITSKYQRRARLEQEEIHYRILGPVLRRRLDVLEPGESDVITDEIVRNSTLDTLRRCVIYHYGKDVFTVKRNMRGRVKSYVVTRNEPKEEPIRIVGGMCIFLLSRNGEDVHKYLADSPNEFGWVTFRNILNPNKDTFRHISPTFKTQGTIVFHPMQFHRPNGLRMLPYQPAYESAWIEQKIKPFYEREAKKDMELFLRRTIANVFRPKNPSKAATETWWLVLERLYSSMNEVAFFSQYRTETQRAKAIEKYRKIGLSEPPPEHRFIRPDDLFGPTCQYFR